MEAENGVDTQALNDGDGPQLIFYNIHPEPVSPGPGWVTGVVISVAGMDFLPAGSGYELHGAFYSISDDLGDEDIVTPVTLCDEVIGIPATPIVIVVAGLSVPSQTNDGTVTISPNSPFVYGDANGDAVIDIADGVAILAFLFNGGPSECDDALDSNNDGVISLYDAFMIICLLFCDSPGPMPPSGCDFDTGVSMGCESSICP